MLLTYQHTLWGPSSQLTTVQLKPLPACARSDRARRLEAREIKQRYREMQTELAYANRVVTIGQLSASIAHEVNQPIGAVVTNAQACLRFLRAREIDPDVLRDVLGDIVKDGIRAGDIIDRIRNLIKKAESRKEPLNVNEAIREVIELARGETVKNGVSVQMDLTQGIPLLEGDRVQIQQVILNLVVNAVEAMEAMNEGARELFISTRNAGSDVVLVGGRDIGPALASAVLERLTSCLR